MKVQQFSIQISFNGKEYTLQAYKLLNLTNVIQVFNYQQKFVVLEYNGKIVHEKFWSRTPIKNKDKIELISIVGGG